MNDASGLIGLPRHIFHTVLEESQPVFVDVQDSHFATQASSTRSIRGELPGDQFVVYGDLRVTEPPRISLNTKRLAEFSRDTDEAIVHEMAHIYLEAILDSKIHEMVAMGAVPEWAFRRFEDGSIGLDRSFDDYFAERFALYVELIAAKDKLGEKVKEHPFWGPLLTKPFPVPGIVIQNPSRLEEAAIKAALSGNPSAWDPKFRELDKRPLESFFPNGTLSQFPFARVERLVSPDPRHSSGYLQGFLRKMASRTPSEIAQQVSDDIVWGARSNKSFTSFSSRPNREKQEWAVAGHLRRDEGNLILHISLITADSSQPNGSKPRASSAIFGQILYGIAKGANELLEREGTQQKQNLKMIVGPIENPEASAMAAKMGFRRFGPMHGDVRLFLDLYKRLRDESVHGVPRSPYLLLLAGAPIKTMRTEVEVMKQMITRPWFVLEIESPATE